MSYDIKKFRNLIESVESELTQLDEGQGDDLLKQTFQSLQVKYQELEGIDTIISTTQKKWKLLKSKPAFKDFPSSWKAFLASILRDNVLETVYDETEDKSLLKKIKNKGTPVFTVFEQLEHYSGIPFSKIKNFNPLTADRPLKKLEEYEEEFIELSEENFVKPSGDEKILVDFGEYAWFDLGKGACADEAEAMGHCGNQPTERPNDRIFSLRKRLKVDGEEYHKPHLTFIYNRGFLGEMKGRANDKPAPKYHRYIIELLKLPIIKGIIGGGYEPEGNFEIDDLDDAMIDELRKAKGDEFINKAGDASQLIEPALEAYRAGDKDAGKEVADLINEYLEDNVYHAGDYEITYNKNRDLFYIDKPDIDSYEFRTLSDGYVDIDGVGIDDFEFFIDEHMTGNMEDAIVQYIHDVYKEDIIDLLAIDEDEYSVDVIKENLNEIISNVADSVEMSLERLNRDAAESGTYGAIIEAVDSAVDDFTEILYLEPISGIDFMDTDTLLIKNNDPKGYLKTIMNDDVAEEEIEEHLKIDQPYYGYMGFDETLMSDESYILNAFDDNDIDLREYLPKDEDNES